MSSDFCRLSDIATVQGGFAFKSADFSDSGVAVVKIANIQPPSVSLARVDRIPHEKLKGLERFELHDGDVLMAMTGATVGKVGRFRRTESAYLNQRVARISATKGKQFDDFVYAVVSVPGFDGLIEGASAGSAQANISASGIGSVVIRRLSDDEQIQIGAVARTLDDRITLLRETNATLEAIAQAIFKSWFVDFDPVRAKQEGRAPEGMDEATATLFPDSFEESALGLVPRGWRVGSVYEVAQVTYGAPFASSQFKSKKIGRPLIRIRDLKDESPSVFTEEVHPKGRLVLPGEIVVGMDGEFRAYLWGGEPAWLNQRLCLFSPLGDAPAAFVRLAISPLLAAVEASETATTVIHLGKNDIDRFKLRIPPSPVLKAFANVANPIYEKIVASKLQATTLAALRDALLPRLISGQLRLPDAENAIAEAAA